MVFNFFKSVSQHWSMGHRKLKSTNGKNGLDRGKTMDSECPQDTMSQKRRHEGGQHN